MIKIHSELSRLNLGIIKQILNQTFHYLSWCCLHCLPLFKLHHYLFNLIHISIMLWISLQYLINLLKQYFIQQTLRTYRVQRVSQLMWHSGINRIQQLILLLSLVTLHSVSNINELYHRCFLIVFFQFRRFYCIEFLFVISFFINLWGV